MNRAALPGDTRPAFSRQAGFTLVELMIGVALAVVLAAASGNLLRDYLATAKTLQVSNEANSEMSRLLRDIRQSFQMAQNRGSRLRGCVLRATPGLNRSQISSYTCYPDQGSSLVATDGIGFEIDAAGSPGMAYVNVCEPIPDGMTLPAGRGGRLNKEPTHPGEIENWGGTQSICPSKCPDKTRPVVKFLSQAGGEKVQRQVPKAITGPTDSPALYLWGGMICANYFTDTVRRLQGLYGDNAGAFEPNYMTISAFIARGRFDIRPSPTGSGSNYVWVNGGLVLEFSESQEMSMYRCLKGSGGDCPSP